jgi:dienelactone hydrolase
MIHNGATVKPLIRLAAWALLLAPAATLAQALSKHEAFAPKSGRGPIVVVISGATGLPYYWDYARRVSELGYFTLLIDGKDILAREQDGAANLRAAIGAAQASPQAMPGKATLIGFSQGAGGILAHGTAMDDVVATAVAYYPVTSWARNPAAVAARIRLPVLVFAGGLDRSGCCLAETARQIAAAAKERERPLELVVYPYADHGFNLERRKYRQQDAEDAWRRTVEMLAKYQPLQ